ncbi:ATP-binding protein [Amycolatopsis tucumanensis]|uniref:ATP-binding protein n=1 Tax=Amycolatopsis tucumanensis TaxID=401106 RepID=A0ABP7HC32_9PSEU|nr:ATP-binding protein [Amycolatopsis tucumanensis]MCF6423791.1 ATP-binding protein [Amycolatopsis tucumanensis]
MRRDEDSDGSGLTLRLAPEAEPPLVQVRRWASQALADLGEDHLVATLLVVTELVTNAYQHGQGATRIRVWREPEPCRIRIEVDDRSSTPPEVRTPDARTPGGRGLQMVGKASLDWGTRVTHGGKTVWAVIDCSAFGWQPCPRPQPQRED